MHVFVFFLLSEKQPVEEEKERSSCPTGTAPQSDPGNNNIVEVTSKVSLK